MPTNIWGCPNCGKTLGLISREGELQLQGDNHCNTYKATLVVVCSGCYTPKVWYFSPDDLMSCFIRTIRHEDNPKNRKPRTREKGV